MASGDMAPKTVGLIGAACLSAGWLVASLLTPPVARLQSLPDRRSNTARQPAGEAVAPTPLVTLGTLSSSGPPISRRNPFVFARRGASLEVTAAAPNEERSVPSADASQEPAVPQIVSPPYKLSGVAVTGDVRTGVLSDGSVVYLVTAGQTIGGYTVQAVSDESVTLVDAGGERFVIRLR